MNKNKVLYAFTDDFLSMKVPLPTIALAKADAESYVEEVKKEVAHEVFESIYEGNFSLLRQKYAIGEK